MCVNPWNVSQAAELLRGSEVRVCTVVGFPLGATLPQVKEFEAEEAIKAGRAGNRHGDQRRSAEIRPGEAVEADIRGVVEASHRGGAICKVILETSLLDRRRESARLAGREKCRRGFREDVHRIQYRRRDGGGCAPDARGGGRGLGVKAAGGVRSLEDLQKMVEAGATRIGASASVKILEQARGRDASGNRGGGSRAATY